MSDTPVLDWSSGLVPAVVQDARTGAVLTLAWMDREALGGLSGSEIRQLIELLDRIRQPGSETQVHKPSNNQRRARA